MSLLNIHSKTIQNLELLKINTKFKIRQTSYRPCLFLLTFEKILVLFKFVDLYSKLI